MAKALSITGAIFEALAGTLYNENYITSSVIFAIIGAILLLVSLISYGIEQKNKKRKEDFTHYCDLAYADYLISGNPQFKIDTFSDLSQEEKADLYDKAVEKILKEKQRNFPAPNPYRTKKHV